MQPSNGFRELRNLFYFYRNYNKSLEFPFLSTDTIKKYQTILLKNIITIAVEKVPFYQPFKSTIDFKNFTLAEIKKLPVISKEIIREDVNQFIRMDVDKSKLKWKSTSGSSGKPFQVAKPYYSDAIESMMGYRAWSMGSHRYTFRSPVIMVRSFSPKEGEPIFRLDKLRNIWFFSPYHINESHLQEIIEVFRRSGAHVLKGYPSSIYILTLLLKKKNIRFPQIRTIVTSSETFLEKYRMEIKDYWNAEIMDWYGQNERTVTIQQCSYGNYHNNDDYGICEIDDENNIIATSLINDIMPLLRYNSRDKAIPNEKIIHCSCGRNTSIPLLGIEGRSDDIIYKDDTTPIATVNFYTLMDQFQKVKQFHLLQNEDFSITMKLSENQTLSESDILAIKNGIKQRTGELAIEIQIVEEITRNTSTDKIKIIESKVKKS